MSRACWGLAPHLNDEMINQGRFSSNLRGQIFEAGAVCRGLLLRCRLRRLFRRRLRRRLRRWRHECSAGKVYLTWRRSLSRAGKVIGTGFGGSPACVRGVILGLVGEPVDANEKAFGGVVMVSAGPKGEKDGDHGEKDKELGGLVHR